MRKETVIGIILTLFIASWMLGFGIQSGRSSPSTIIVPDDFPSIQQAISAASAGDTIFVRAGTYQEEVVVDKPLSLIGQKRETTQIRGAQCVLTILSDSVMVKNFTIINVVPDPYAWSYGVLIKASNSLLANNCIPEAKTAVYVDGTKQETENNTIIDSYITRGHISVDCVANITIASNILKENVQAIRIGGGARSYRSGYRILIFNNSISGKGNTSTMGVDLITPTRNAIVIANNISGYTYSGSFPDYPHGAGISLRGATQNQIVYNQIFDNRIGIYQNLSASYNTIHHNSFINNSLTNVFTKNSYVPCANTWDNGYDSGGNYWPFGGNYWSNYTGLDVYRGPHQNQTGSDGIGDVPYAIDDLNEDRYPLLSPVSYSLPPWDMTGSIKYVADLKCDTRDLAFAATLFGSVAGDGKYDSRADITGSIYLVPDLKIDIRDIALVAKHFGGEAY